MSVKLAAVTLLCSFGLALCSSAADARCCRRNRCCTPAPTCCAPAPTCCAPAAPAATAPATEPAPVAPAPSASLPGGDPALASSDGRQTFRSYSYDSAPAGVAAPAAAAPARTTRKAPESNMFRANRKMFGVRY